MTNTSSAQVTATSTKSIQLQELTKHFFINLKTVLLLSQENQDDGPIGQSAKAIAVSTETLESWKGVAR